MTIRLSHLQPVIPGIVALATVLLAPAHGHADEPSDTYLSPAHRKFAQAMDHTSNVGGVGQRTRADLYIPPERAARHQAAQKRMQADWEKTFNQKGVIGLRDAPPEPKNTLFKKANSKKGLLGHVLNRKDKGKVKGKGKKGNKRGRRGKR